MKNDLDSLRQETIDLLIGGICEVTFTKVNGEQRVMPCTLKTEFLPKRTDLTFDVLKENKSDAISIWCTDANAWRSFKLSNLISIIPLYDNRTKDLDSNT